MSRYSFHSQYDKWITIVKMVFFILSESKKNRRKDNYIKTPFFPPIPPQAHSPSSPRPMLFASKTYALRPQELWFSSARAMVLETKSAFRRGQNLWSWRPTAPSDRGKSGWGRTCVVGCFNSINQNYLANWRLMVNFAPRSAKTNRFVTDIKAGLQ